MKKRYLTAGLALFLGIAAFGLPPFSGGPNADYLSDENFNAFKSDVKRQANGVYQVSALTPMPGVDAKMVKWWFADYMQTSEHYKRWHPDAHLWMDWENKSPGDYVGASHLVHEYIGSDVHKLRIQFVPPEEILGDTSHLRPDDVAVCARPGLLEKPINGGKMCHIIRNTDNGAVMLSRFWMGHVAKRDGNDTKGSIEGILGNTYLARMAALRKSSSLDLMRHAETEMGILAEFLPELYKSETQETP